MNKEKYAQCTLEKRDGNSTLRTVSYLPQKFAKKGWIVDLKEENGNWDKGWNVVEVGKLTTSPPDWRALIKGHRKMTGDSLPK